MARFLIFTTYKLLSSSMILYWNTPGDRYIFTCYKKFIDFDNASTLNDHALIIFYIFSLSLMI